MLQLCSIKRKNKTQNKNAIEISEFKMNKLAYLLNKNKDNALLSLLFNICNCNVYTRRSESNFIANNFQISSIKYNRFKLSSQLYNLMMMISNHMMMTMIAKTRIMNHQKKNQPEQLRSNKKNSRQNFGRVSNNSKFVKFSNILILDLKM